MKLTNIFMLGAILITSSAFADYSTVKLKSLESFATLIIEGVNSGEISQTECLLELAELKGIKARAEVQINNNDFDSLANEIISSVNCD